MGWLNIVAVFAHISAILVIVVALQTMPSELNTWSWVLSTYHNDSGFKSPTYVVSTGITGAFYMFVGYEASAHLAEETSGRSGEAPRGIIRTIQATVVGGAMLLLALLFATPPNIVDALGQGSYDTGCVAINVLAIAVGKTWAMRMASLIAVNMFFGGLASVAVTGRIAFALARDGALPCSQTLSRTHEKFQSPVNCLLFIFVMDSIVLLLPLMGDGGQTAFYAIINLSTLGFQVSYLIPIILRQFSNPTDFPSAPMNLGKFSKVTGTIAIVWLLGSSLLLFLPYESPVTAGNFNWLCVVTTITILAGTCNWLFNSRFSFTGPNRIVVEKREAVLSDEVLWRSCTFESKPLTEVERRESIHG
jgi:amino acid transporter